MSKHAFPYYGWILLACLVPAIAACTGNDSPKAEGNEDSSQDSGTPGDEGGSDTTAGGDAQQLTVSSVYPADGAEDVAIDTHVSATLSNDINESAQESALKLYLGSYQVPAAVSNMASPFDEIRLDPSEPLQRGMSYTAVLSADLEDNGFNTLGTNYSWSFSTEDRSWSAPVRLDDNSNRVYFTQSDTSERGAGAVLALDEDGNAWVAWGHTTGLENQVELWVRYYDADQAQWQSAQKLGTHNYQEFWGPYHPAVAIAGSGDAMVVFPDRSVDQHLMRAYHYSAGDQSWAAPLTIGVNTTSDSGVSNADFRSPTMAMNSAGQALVVWGQIVGQTSAAEHRVVWANQFEPGAGWAAQMTPISLENYAGVTWGEPSRWGRHPTVAIDAAGNGVAVWTERYSAAPSSGYWMSVMARHYTAGTGWSDNALRLETDIDDLNEIDTRPRIVNSGDNRFVAAWQAEDSLKAAHYDGDTWTAPQQLGESYWDSFALSAGADGNLMAVWTSDNALNFSRYTAGSGWDDAAELFSQNSIGSRFVELRYHHDGSARLISGGNSGSAVQGLYHHRFDGRKWAQPSELPPVPGMYKGMRQQLAVNGQGEAMVLSHGGGTWGTSSELYAQILE